MKRRRKKISTRIKIIVIICCTLIGCYGILYAPPSDEEKMEQELKNREQELKEQQSDSHTLSPEEGKASPQSKQEKRTITVIGDSVFLGASASFQKLEKDAVIDAKISRQVRHGIDVAKKLKKEGKLGNTIILSLGTNSPFNPVTGQELIDYLGPDRTIYWINAYGKNLEFQQEVNKTIKGLTEKNSNVHLIPWAKEAKKHPDWFYQDGTHLNEKGQNGFAKYIHEQLNPQEEQKEVTAVSRIYGTWEIKKPIGTGYIFSDSEPETSYVGGRITIEENRIDCKLPADYLSASLANPEYIKKKQDRNDFFVERYANYDSFGFENKDHVTKITIMTKDGEWDEFGGCLWIRDNQHIVIAGPQYFLAEKVSG